jgi:hypothetical protein
MTAPTHTFAAGHQDKSITKKAITVIEKNPGASVGVAACGVAVAFFPPALLVCGGVLTLGVGVDQTNK